MSFMRYPRTYMPLKFYGISWKNSNSKSRALKSMHSSKKNPSAAALLAYVLKEENQKIDCLTRVWCATRKFCVISFLERDESVPHAIFGPHIKRMVFLLWTALPNAQIFLQQIVVPLSRVSSVLNPMKLKHVKGNQLVVCYFYLALEFDGSTWWMVMY